MESQTLTYRFRLRDKHARELQRQTRAVNFVWNYCNEVQRKAAKERRRWLSGFDLCKLTGQTSKELGLHAHTIQAVAKQYARSRDQHKRPWLRWRGRKSLGWVPFNTETVRVKGKAFVFRGISYSPMHWRAIPPGAKLGAGSFAQDSRGRWYINLPVKIPVASAHATPAEAVGIDLGLKSLAVTSDGEAIENHRHYRAAETALAVAQRARKKKWVKAIHAKVANQRRDHLHKTSDRLARAYALIAVGDVSSSRLAKTRMAKSVLDAGWSELCNMLSYKAIRHGGKCVVVDEKFSTQTCSRTGMRPEGRPRGIAGLGIREWHCEACGELHDRDINAARNILRAGMRTLVEGAPL